jgi:hypothetical protein
MKHKGRKARKVSQRILNAFLGMLRLNSCYSNYCVLYFILVIFFTSDQTKTIPIKNTQVTQLKMGYHQQCHEG